MILHSTNENSSETGFDDLVDSILHDHLLAGKLMEAVQVTRLKSFDILIDYERQALLLLR